MPKKRQTPSSHSSGKSSRSPVEITIARYALVGTTITALLALLGVAITGYLTYLASQKQAIQLTNTPQTLTTRPATSIQPTFGLTSEPEATFQTSPLIASPRIACIIDQQESGTPAKIRADFLFYSSTALGSIQELPLVSGQKISFSDIQSIDVMEIHEKTIGGIKASITLLTGNVVVGVVVSSQYDGSRLTGPTDYGSFELRLLDLKRVEFREDDNCS